MRRAEGPKEGSYDFFDNIREYIQKADKAKSDERSDEDYFDCKSFSEMWKSKLKTKENAETICKQFINLYKSLSNINNKLNVDPDFKKDSSFLNYWVNMIISEHRPNDQTYVSDFADQMETYCMTTFSRFNELSDLLYDIKGDDFNKINILYNLYVNYDNVKNNIGDLSPSNKASVTYSDICYYTYKIAESMHNDQDTRFKEKLTKFTSEYKELYPTFEEKERIFNIYFKRLSDNPNNIITTSVLGSLFGLIPFMGILYKFTPMGQYFRSKNKKFTEEYRNNDDDQISLHQERYNIKYHSVSE